MSSSAALESIPSGPLGKLFSRLRADCEAIADLFTSAGRTRVELEKAQANFDRAPSSDTLARLIAAQDTVKKLDASLPDENQLLSDAAERILLARESWRTLAGEVHALAVQREKVAERALVEFADALREFVLQTGETDLIVRALPEKTLSGKRAGDLFRAFGDVQNRASAARYNANWAKKIADGGDPESNRVAIFKSIAGTLIA